MTLTEFRFSTIGRVDIEGSGRIVATNDWLLLACAIHNLPFASIYSRLVTPFPWFRFPHCVHSPSISFLSLSVPSLIFLSFGALSPLIFSHMVLTPPWFLICRLVDFFPPGTCSPLIFMSLNDPTPWIFFSLGTCSPWFRWMFTPWFFWPLVLPLRGFFFLFGTCSSWFLFYRLVFPIPWCFPFGVPFPLVFLIPWSFWSLDRFYPVMCLIPWSFSPFDSFHLLVSSHPLVCVNSVKMVNACSFLVWEKRRPMSNNRRAGLPWTLCFHHACSPLNLLHLSDFFVPQHD